MFFFSRDRTGHNFYKAIWENGSVPSGGVCPKPYAVQGVNYDDEMCYNGEEIADFSLPYDYMSLLSYGFIE